MKIKMSPLSVPVSERTDTRLVAVFVIRGYLAFLGQSRSSFTLYRLLEVDLPVCWSVLLKIDGDL